MPLTEPNAVRETNALHDTAQRLKLGLFGTNASGGIVMTDAPTGYELSWPHTSSVAR